MGDYFVMSIRFNKCNATDFGFIANSMNTAINPKDGSLWIKPNLYDFGWGKENGFYRVPLPGFSVLFELVLYSKNKEDMYGAAAVINENFPDELLFQCELFMNDSCRKKEFVRLVELFNLKLPINRCHTSQKSYEQIQKDYVRWKKVAEESQRI